MLAASLKAVVEIAGIPKGALELKKFGGEVDKFDGKSATAKLNADISALDRTILDARGKLLDLEKQKSDPEVGLDTKKFDAEVDAAKLKIKELGLEKADVTLRLRESRSGDKLLRDIEKAATGGSGGNGLGSAIGEALTPFGKLPTVLAAASPAILGTIGGLTAIAGSAGEAAAGVGALGIAAGGVASVGLAGLASVAVPAISGLKKLYSAQTKYTEAVKLYGSQSKQAATALAKLHLAEQGTGPEADKLVKSLDSVKTKWSELTKPGQNNFLGIGADALSRFEKLMPTLSSSANTSVAALRQGFDGFLEQVTGPGFNHFIETMTGTFARIVPEIGHGLADWAQIFMRIAEDAAPSLEHIVHLWKDWSDEVLKSTGNSQKMKDDISGLVDQTLSWVHLLGAAGQLIVSVFSSGASEGQRLVDDLTGKLEQWTDWINSHQTQVHEFFHRAAETLRDLSTIFGSFLGQWVVFSEALRPISTAVLTITKALNSIKIGNVSALTLLLGAFVAARGIGKIGGAITSLSSLGGLAGGGAASEAATVAEGAGAGAGAGGAAVAGRSALSRVAGALSPGEAELSPFGVAGAVAAGYFVTEFASKVVDLGTEGQSVAKSLFDGFNTQEVAKTEARALAGAYAREVSRALADGGNPGALKGASHNRARTISSQQTEAMREEASVLDSLQSGLVTRMGDIVDLARRGSLNAAAAFGEGTPQWRKATADNLGAVIESIKAGEDAGLITTEEGQKKIGQYLREANLVTGKDPFHIATAFTQSWKEAGGVNDSGISAAIAELRQMPPVSQAIAEQTMLQQVKAFEAGGKVAKGTFSRLRSAIVTELQRTREHGGAQVAHFADEMGGSFTSLSIVAAEAFQNIGGNLGALLSKLGAHNPLQSFTAKYLHAHGAQAGSGSKYLGQVPEVGKQRGGHINMGAPTGDSVPAMLERGEYVLNRNAVAAVGTQNLDALNYGSHSRFQKGGQAGRLQEPQVSGSGPLHDAGQGAVHDAYGAAGSYLQKHTPHSSGVGYIPAGGGSVVAQMGRVLLAAGYNKIGAAGVIGNALQESGWNPASVGSGGGGLLGFTSGAISLASLQAFAKAQGKPWTDVGLQMQFFLNNEAGIRAGVNAQKSAGAAAAYFMNNWEHPAVATENQAHREEGARIAFAKGYQRGGPVDPRQHLTKSQRDAYLAWKWGKRFANGGLVGEAEAESGVPKTSSSSTVPSASDAVHWAMRHLGQSQPWASEYPGEWCGDFLADDMRSIGLTPPSGYPEAFAWGGYGTNLGKAHMQAGAIIDYGHQHVAMAISASEMVQGNDVNGVVGTSSIVSEVGGSPISAVRWPPYGSGPGAGSTPTETVPGTFHGAHTGALPSKKVPGTMRGIDQEIHRWGAQLTTYEGAAKAAAGKPKTQQAIQKNVQRILKYLRELHHARYQLHNKIAKAHFSNRLTTKLGKLTGREKQIEGAQRAYEVANQYASQLVSLEPQEPILSSSATEAEQIAAQKAYAGAYEQYVTGKESPAYEAILGKEATWRNSILGAEYAAIDLETGWEGRITRLGQNEMAAEAFAEQVQGEVENWKQHHKGKALPSQLQGREKTRNKILRELPMFKFEERELRSKLGEARGEFYPGIYGAIHPPQPPLAGSGTFEQNLQQVQGIHWPDQHEYLGAGSLAPPRIAGKFGGAIWETQEAIEELGLKIQQAQANISTAGGSEAIGGASTTNTEREQLLEELLRQSRQRELIGEIERKTLAPARIPAFATGGLIAAKVGERGPEIAAFPEGTRIHNASESRSMLQPHVRVQVNHYGPEDTEVKVNEQVVAAEINRRERRGARTARRGLARAG